VHLNANEQHVIDKQNPLQKGFTKSTSPNQVAVIITELIAEAKDNKSPLLIAYMDAEKAFDKVWQASLLRKLFLTGITGNSWQVMKNLYQDLFARVKWNNSISQSFQELQGVRQGGVWSPTAYKVFINDLLDQLQDQRIGARIGTIYCGSPTVADDVCLAASSPEDLQCMIDLQSLHANRQICC
jgi:hypothetical protein